MIDCVVKNGDEAVIAGTLTGDGPTTSSSSEDISDVLIIISSTLILAETIS